MSFGELDGNFLRKLFGSGQRWGAPFLITVFILSVSVEFLFLAFCHFHAGSMTREEAQKRAVVS
jgi:hypothetical protein